MTQVRALLAVMVVASIAAIAILASLHVRASAGAGTDAFATATPATAAPPPAAPIEPATDDGGEDAGPAGLPATGSGWIRDAGLTPEELVAIAIACIGAMGLAAAVYTRKRL